MKQISTSLLFLAVLYASPLSAQCPITVDAGPDVYACAVSGSATIYLNGEVPPNVVSFEWYPPIPLGTPLSTKVTTTAPVSHYILKARAVDYDNNLIVNGDFEQGNTGFISAAAYSPGDLTQPYTYDILTNPQDANPTFAPCGDHTTGSSNMMAINPHMTQTTILTVWCQTVTLQPDMFYYISLSHTKTDSVGISSNVLKVYMDGIAVLTGVSGPGASCQWKSMQGTWYNFNQTSVEMCIELTSNPPGGGHIKWPSPIAIDDIGLYPTCVAYDSVFAFVNHLTIAPAANYTIPCAGSPITLNATTGTSAPGPNVTYQWSTTNGHIVSGANTLTPTVDQPGTYSLDLQFQSSTHSCTLQSSFVVTEAPALGVNILQPKPLACNSPAVSLKATTNVPDNFAYTWAAGSGGNITTGANTATPLVNQPGTYTVTITNTKTGCTATAEHTVDPPEPPPIANATANTITCAQPQATLSSDGSTTGTSMIYLWSTTNGTITSAPTLPTATASSVGTYILQVLYIVTGCRAYDTVQVTANLVKPTLALATPGVLICKKPDTIALAATVLPATATLAWSAANGGNILSGAATAAPKVNATGTYTLTATDPANGCTAKASVEVKSTVNLAAVVAPPPLLTCSLPAFALNAAGSSTGPGIQYLWTTTGGSILSGNTTLAPTIAAPGTYHLLVTDTLSSCAKTLDIKILAEKTAPKAEAAPAPSLNCNLPTATLSALRLDTLPNITFGWTTADGNILAGADSLTPTIGAGGTYTLLLTNLDNGCTTTLAVPVVADFQPPALQIAPAPALTCTTLSLDLSAAASSTSGQLVYGWTATNGGNIQSGEATATPKIDQPGNYTLTVWDDANGCSATAFVTVALDREPPALSIVPAPALTCAVTTLDLSATATGGNPQYAWAATGGGNILSGSTSAAPKIDQPGTYTLTVTDLGNGCTATAETTISANTAPPQVDAGPALTLTCAAATAALSGSGSTGPNFSYGWTTLDGNIVSGGNTLTPTVNAAGTYLLQILDNQNGCAAADQVLVQKEANVPAAQIQPPGTLTCLSPTVQLNAIGTSQGPGITFTWSAVGGNFLSGQNTLTPTVNAPGQYTLSVLNTMSNCAVSTVVTVTENRVLPIAQVAAPAQINCLNTTLSLDASGSSQGAGYALTWTVSGGGNILSGNTGLAPIVNAAGTYALLITDPSNGCTASTAVTVTANTAPPQAEAGPSATLTCTTATLALSGSGSTGPNFSYGWTTLDGNILSGGNTLTPTVSAGGTYILQIVDNQNGCAATDQTSVQKDANVPNALIQTPGPLTCKTASLQLSASGTSQGPDFTYNWTTAGGGGGNIVSGSTTLTPTVNQPGTYILLVTNTTNGCSAIATATVLADRTPPAAAASAPAVLDCKTPSLALSGAGSSTGSPYAYDWTATAGGNFVSGKNTLAPVVDQPGTYTLLVTNLDNGCTATAIATVLLDKTAPAAQVALASQLDCATTSLALSGSGSAQGANMTYGWTASGGGNIVSGNTTLAPTVNQPGTYALLVTNTANGCTAQVSVAVSRDVAPPTAAVAPPAMLNCAVTSLALDGKASSQGSNFAYNWTASGGNIVSGNTMLSPVVNQPGTYNLLITNTSNHCTSTASVAVAQDLAKPQVTTTVPFALDCATTSLSLSASVTGAGSSFETTWTTGDGLILSGGTTLFPTVGAAGTYTVLIKNLSNGCTQTATAQVLKDVAAPLSAAAAPVELTCKTAQIDLSGAGSSTGSDFAYAWTTTGSGLIVSGNTTLAPTVSKPGVYTLVVTNTANHCTATATTTVLRNIQPPQANAGAGGLLTCTTKQLSLAGSGAGGASGVAYAWAGSGIASGANTAAPLVTSAGIYALTVTDLYNGCTASSQTVVGQDLALPVGGIAPPAVLDCLAKTVALSGSVSTPASGYSVTWTGTGLVSGVNTLAPTVNQPGVYTLHITNSANGCTALATASVSQNIEPPVAKASGSFELNCTVLQGTLSAAGSSTGANFQYAWAAAAGGGNIVSGGNSATPVVNAPGTYTLMVSNLQNHCTASQLVQVTQNTNVPTALALDEQPPNCKKPTGSVRITAVTGGTGPYLYSLDGGTTFGSASLFNQLAPGSYALVVQDASGCEHEQTLSFDAPVQPTVTLGPDVRLVFGEAGKLSATVNLPPDQIASVTWSPMEGLTLTADPLVVIAKPLRSTYYTVTVVNKEGCEAKISLRAQVDDPHLWAPNVFSPGRRDGDNDFFLLFASDNSVQIIKTLQVFDRWGTMVFRNDDLLPNVEKMGWDGSFRGQTVQPAVFAWYAEVLLANGELVLMKGDVTLVD